LPSVKTLLKAELDRIEAIADDKELDSLTYEQRREIKAKLYELDDLGRKLLANAEALASREAELCVWRKLAALSGKALKMFSEEDGEILNVRPLARSIVTFNLDLLRVSRGIKAATAAMSSPAISQAPKSPDLTEVEL
jgi:hypothetical protein